MSLKTRLAVQSNSTGDQQAAIFSWQTTICTLGHGDNNPETPQFCFSDFCFVLFPFLCIIFTVNRAVGCGLLLPDLVFKSKVDEH